MICTTLNQTRDPVCIVCDKGLGRAAVGMRATAARHEFRRDSECRQWLTGIFGSSLRWWIAEGP
jgi:hypothetical protein